MGVKTLFAVVVTLVFWSSAFAGIREGLAGGYSPGHVVLLRFLSASLVFILYALVKRVKIPEKRDIPRIVFLGLVGITIYHTSLTFGELTVPAGTASLVIAAAPAFTALISSFVLREYLTKLGWLGIAVGFAGILLITLGSHQSAGFSNGVLLILLSAICTAAFFVFQKPLFARYRAVDLTAYFTWVGTIPLLWFLPGFVHDVTHATMSATIATVYIGVFPAAVAYVAWAIALSLAPANVVASSLYVNPVLAIFIAWAWLGEVPHLISILGGLVAICGVTIVNVSAKRKKRVAQMEHVAIIQSVGHDA